MADWLKQLNADGYTILTSIFTPPEIEAACCSCAAALARPDAADSVLGRENAAPHGARNLLRLWPEAAALARKPALARALISVLGAQGGIVRGLYFDKPPGSGWALPWHRDLTVAVREHVANDGFSKPTVKAGIPHYQAPAKILANMVTARIHLDAMAEHNGPLRVIPGSHTPQDSDDAAVRSEVTVGCLAGDVMLMRPLLLHASASCEPEHQGHRRIIHLEFASSPDLPGGCEWDTFVPFDQLSDSGSCKQWAGRH